tara:strand:+ start:335 stop:565 length:231 start_codon:yes stop_codon:yes gene_type:complete
MSEGRGSYVRGEIVRWIEMFTRVERELCGGRVGLGERWLIELTQIFSKDTEVIACTTFSLSLSLSLFFFFFFFFFV